MRAPGDMVTRVDSDQFSSSFIARVDFVVEVAPAKHRAMGVVIGHGPPLHSCPREVTLFMTEVEYSSYLDEIREVRMLVAHPDRLVVLAAAGDVDHSGAVVGLAEFQHGKFAPRPRQLVTADLYVEEH